MLIKQLIEETCSCSCGGLPVLEYDTETRMYRVACDFLEDGTKEGVHLKTRFFPNLTDAIRDWETFVGKRTGTSDVKDSIDITDSVTRIKGDSLIVHDCTVCHKKPRFFKSPGKDKWYQLRCGHTHSDWMPSLSTAISAWNVMFQQNETKKGEETPMKEKLDPETEIPCVCGGKPQLFYDTEKRMYCVACEFLQDLNHPGRHFVTEWYHTASMAEKEWEILISEDKEKNSRTAIETKKGVEQMGDEEIDRPDYKPLDIPELGISFKRFYSDKIEKFIAAWKNEDCSHVYEVVLRPLPLGTGWTAEGLNDGRNIFTITTSGKWRLRQMALAAMKASLIYTHRRTWKKVRKEKKVSKTSTEK